MDREARRSLDRLLPRLKDRLAAAARQDRSAFLHRLEEGFPGLFDILRGLYGGRYDFFYHLESVLAAAASAWMDRPAELKELDARRQAEPRWYQSEKTAGAVCYVDLFAGNLVGLAARIPYLQELGITYLHLMPLFRCPEGESDGGYAVSSYREVNPALGTMEELRDLAARLREAGISLVLDFVFNHTSNEHRWALAAAAGDPDYQGFYFLFPDRSLPDVYSAHLRDIFPGVRPGSFTYRGDLDRWVWTTFHSYQWDLNYGNPAVFTAMAEEMLFLANQGVEVLRLDALAFTWKKPGTPCENLPEAHALVRAFNAVARLAAPALLFKSEAIVHPDEVARYIHPQECQLSYNPTLMALLWEALATREVRLLHHSLAKRLAVHPACAWVNYVRCHDDIGWTFSDEDAAELGMNGTDHRRFLNSFYTGAFPGSFARGLPFQLNPRTGDARVSGTCASLAGLEKALREETEAEVELALRRILLIHGVILSVGGIPLIYLGDELAVLNDYSYRSDPDRARDSRWAHRSPLDWQRAERRRDAASVPGRLFQALQGLLRIRSRTPAFAAGEAEMLDSGNPHVLAYLRRRGAARVLVLANFSEQEQRLPANLLRVHGLSYGMQDLPTSELLEAAGELSLQPYRLLWLVPEEAAG